MAQEKSFWDSYLGELRKLVGARLLQVPAARVVLEDAQGRVLLIRRTDFDKWALPAGSPELNESLHDCAVREVREETGLDLVSFDAYGFASEPVREVVTFPNGHMTHGFALLFWSREWRGELVRATDETSNARFFAPEDFPPLEEWLPNERRSVDAYLDYKRSGHFQWT